MRKQLTEDFLQLASLKFEKLGFLREDSNGGFYIVPYVDSLATACSKHKAIIYEELDFSCQGPFYLRLIGTRLRLN